MTAAAPGRRLLTRIPVPRFLAPKALIPRTLRGRLIAGLVALLAVACATVGLTTYFSTKDSLLGSVRDQLQTATQIWSTCVDTVGDGDRDAPPPAAGGQPGSTGDQDGMAVQAAGGANHLDAPKDSASCLGLAPGTLEAQISHGQLLPYVVENQDFEFTAADKRVLKQLTVTTMHKPGSENKGPGAPTYIRQLSSLGPYELTAVRDADGDTTCITGLPLGNVYDTLHDLAVTELLVFGTVLLLAGVLGTLWVGLSLRPLRRVAATASQVAELPLESGEVELPAGVPDTDPRTETGQVGAAFNRMLGHVQTALARRNASETRLRRFAADASHELRTPLAAIRGYAELALRHPDDSPEPVIHALNRVLSESARMTLLVDDLLLLARLDAGRPLGREQVDMSRVAIDATSDARVARPGHRWVLDLPDDPVMVRGDEHRLQQVLVNLLSNAGRHTPEGTTVTVKLSAAPEAPAEAGPETGVLAVGGDGAEAGTVSRGALPPTPRIALTVTDNGPGIPASLLPELFERFTRADTARSHAVDPSSTGLGLAIVDAVVAAHGGAVRVTSQPGLTRFAIILPRLAEPAEAPQRRGRPARKALNRS
jgi:two-component system OmpR family sensor kinase